VTKKLYFDGANVGNINDSKKECSEIQLGLLL